MLPLLSVTTWLTVPRVAPPLVLTVRPVVSPGNDVLGTALRARALLVFARLIARGLAFSRPWLLGARVVGVVFEWIALFGFACVIAFGEAFTEPRVLTRASSALWLGPPTFAPAFAPALTLAW